MNRLLFNGDRTAKRHPHLQRRPWLAGDVLRSTADLEMPMVAVTLVSRLGYFRQMIDDQSRQSESPDHWDPAQNGHQWCSVVAAVAWNVHDEE